MTDDFMPLEEGVGEPPSEPPDELLPTDLPIDCYDDEEPPPIEFKTWVLLAVKLLHRDADEQQRLLGSRNVPESEWAACNYYWLTRLTRDLQEGNARRPQHYAQRCAAELQDRARAAAGRDPQEDVAPKSAVAPTLPSPSFAAVDETGFVQALGNDVLPFSEAENDAARPRLTEDANAARSGKTQALAVVPTSVTTPFEVRHHLERYVALCVELEGASAAERGDVLQRYSLADETALSLLKTAWEEQLATRPQLREIFETLLEAPPR